MGVSVSGFFFLTPRLPLPPLLSCFKFLPVNNKSTGLNFKQFLPHCKVLNAEWKRLLHSINVLAASPNLQKLRVITVTLQQYLNVIME